MKKIIFTVALLTSMMSLVNAQARGRAIGIRGGNGGEISFQTALGSGNRLELDLGRTGLSGGSNYYGTQITGIYQWVKSLNDLGPGFNWYAGLGGTLGFYNNRSTSNTDFGLGIVGQLGIEYNFNIPLQLAFDWRPNFYFGGHDGYDNAGFSLRYRF